MMRIIAVAVLLLTVTPSADSQPLTISGIPIYGIADNGELYWRFHQGAHNGSPAWTGQGRSVKVGSGWNEGRFVLKGSGRGREGIIYRIASNGDLYWYRHIGHTNGTANWAGPNKIGSGWQRMRLVFAAGEGIIYAVHSNGDLLWYRHRGYRSGRIDWANQADAARVGVGWNNMRLVFSGGRGIIYAVDPRGDLYWYRHTGYTDGRFAWANNAEGTRIASGWNDVASAFSGGDGVIYVLKRDGNLYWYNHSGFSTGAAAWANQSGNRIGARATWGGMVRIF